MTRPLIATRRFFTNPPEWQAAMELLKRGYKVQDRKRYFLWEWIALNKTS